MNTVLLILLAIASVAIIVSVMLQQSTDNGAGALGGVSTAAAKKAKGHEAMLSKITVFATIAFVIFTLILVIIE